MKWLDLQLYLAPAFVQFLSAQIHFEHIKTQSIRGANRRRHLKNSRQHRNYTTPFANRARAGAGLNPLFPATYLFTYSRPAVHPPCIVLRRGMRESANHDDALSRQTNQARDTSAWTPPANK